MKITASIQANNTKTTQITINSEDSITVNGEITDLSAILNGGSAEGVSPLIGDVTRNDSGEVSLTVLISYVPSATPWNGQGLTPLQINVFPTDLTIEDFIL